MLLLRLQMHLWAVGLTTVTPCLGVYLLLTYASYNAFKTVWPELFAEPHVFLTPLH